MRLNTLITICFVSVASLCYGQSSKPRTLSPDAKNSGNASGGAQAFAQEGFTLKCNCKLAPMPEFIATARKQGRNALGAYGCAENQADAGKSVIIKVNVTDESAGYAKIRADSINYYNARYAAYLASDMKKRGFTTYEIMHNGNPGVECRGTQDKLPTMILIVVRNKRVYTLSVSAKSNVTKHFERVRSSFSFL